MLNILKATPGDEGLRTLHHGDGVFHDALAWAAKGETRFRVSNPNGEDYVLEYTRNMDLFPAEARAYLKMTDGKDVFPPYLSYDESDVDKLCLDYLKTFDEAMFEAIDEYALVCARLLLKHTQAQVWFTDARARWFLPASERLHIVEALPKDARTKDSATLYVIPGINETGYTRRDYSYMSSMPAFHNVFFWQWLTDKPFEQIRYVEMILYKDLGLGAILNRVYAYNRLFSRKGWRAFLSPGSSRYSDELLMRYFAVDGRPADADGENTVVADNMTPLVTTWQFQQYGQGIEADVFRPEFRAQLEEYAEAVLGGRKALGVLIRGSDYVVSKLMGMYQQATPEQMMPMIDRWIEEDGYDIVFLATEDRDAYEKMKQRYGKKLRAISQERFAVSDFKDVTLISELEKKANAPEHYQDAVEDTTVNYIYAVYTLSRCESLIGSGFNNGYNMALSLNGGKYRRVYQFQVGVK